MMEYTYVIVDCSGRESILKDLTDEEFKEADRGYKEFMKLYNYETT